MNESDNDIEVDIHKSNIEEIEEDHECMRLTMAETMNPAWMMDLLC